jgi:hypothetical protein
VPLPTSTIVFALVTCVPFGLAIRDTVTGKYQVPEIVLEEDFDRDEYDEDSERFEEDRRDLLEARLRESELERSMLQGTVHGLIGDEVATLGTTFDGLTLGTSPSENTAVENRLDELRYTAHLEVVLSRDGETVHSVYVKPLRANRQELCEAIEHRLTEQWGDGQQRGTSRRVWINEASQQRALFDRSGCELRFEKLSPIAQWLDRSESSLVPMWAVGQPVQKLIDTLGDRPSVTSFEVEWTVRGIGAGTGTTAITADVRKGKVVSLFVSVETDPATQQELIAHITALTGKDPREDALVWKSNPPIEMHEGSFQMFLTIGTRPEN